MISKEEFLEFKKSILTQLDEMEAKLFEENSEVSDFTEEKVSNLTEDSIIAISNLDYEKYGCPKCGYDCATIGRAYMNNAAPFTCKTCGLKFVILADGLETSPIGIATDREDDNGEMIFEYPVRIQHPREGMQKHKYIAPDPTPTGGGEYWHSRGVGRDYNGRDIAGFVKSKQAGERILQMVKDVTGKEKPDSWLDYRDFEPNWIQFKFRESEFDVDMLHRLTIDTDIITEEILQKAKK